MNKIQMADWVPENLRIQIRGAELYAPIVGSIPNLKLAKSLLVDPRMIPAWELVKEKGLDEWDLYSFICKFGESWNSNSATKSMSKKQTAKWEEEVRSLAKKLARTIRLTPYDNFFEKMGLQVAGKADAMSATPVRIKRLSEMLTMLSMLGADELESPDTYTSMLRRRTKNGNFPRELMIILNWYFEDKAGEPLHTVTAAVFNSLMKKTGNEEFSALHVKQKLVDVTRSQSEPPKV